MESVLAIGVGLVLRVVVDFATDNDDRVGGMFTSITVQRYPFDPYPVSSDSRCSCGTVGGCSPQSLCPTHASFLRSISRVRFPNIRRFPLHPIPLPSCPCRPLVAGRHASSRHCADRLARLRPATSLPPSAQRRPPRQASRPAYKNKKRPPQRTLICHQITFNVVVVGIRFSTE